MFSLTLWRSHAPRVHPLVRATSAFVVSMTLLALLGWGQHTITSADAFRGVPAVDSSSCAHASASQPLLVLPAVSSAGCTTLSQSASLQPEAMTSTALLMSPGGERAAASHAPDPDLAGSGVSVIWLLPLGGGIIVLGVFFVVTMWRHRHDDIDER